MRAARQYLGICGCNLIDRAGGEGQEGEKTAGTMIAKEGASPQTAEVRKKEIYSEACA